jgi:spoIIIJ-associated protein
MEWVETTGKTLEEARDAALDMLGVDESDAEFVTLTEPRPGLFGRLRGEARVRARVMPTTPSAPKAPKAKKGSSPDSRSDGPKAAASRDLPEYEDTDSAPASGTGRSRSARRRRSRAGAPNGSASADSPASNGSTAPTSPQSRSGQRRSTVPERHEEEETVTETLSLEEQGDLAKRFIEGLVAELGLRATVSARALDDEAVQVAVDGDELGLLVGQGGATLAALQELTRTVVQRKAGGRTERILVDVAGYRAKRAEALGKFTRKVVEEVVSSGHEKALEAMSAADRKVVHDTVNEVGGASTRSEGEDPHRYVVMSPTSSVESPDDEPESVDAES